MLNKVQIIGNLGADPETRTFESGDMVANFSLATSESWKNKDGEKQTKTEWVNIVVFGKLAEVCERYVKKGDKIYVEGKLRSRSYESDGTTKYITEVVLEKFGGNMIMLGGKKSEEGSEQAAPAESSASESVNEPLEVDDIPF